MLLNTHKYLKQIRFYFVLSLICLLSVGKLQAENHLTDTISVHWQNQAMFQLKNGSTAKLLYFEDASTRYETASLPWYLMELQLPASEKASNLQLFPIATDTLNFGEADMPADIQFASDQYQISFFNGDYVSVLPVRKIGENQLERLLQFTVSYETLIMPRAPKEETPSWKNNSVLASGSWFKIGVTDQGVYKITFSDLQQMGINPASLNPEHMALYGNINGMLPEENLKNRPDDLTENAILIVGGEDGRFDTEDYILFFGLSPVIWKHNVFTGSFDHQINYFSDTTFYYLRIDQDTPGKRIPSKPSSSAVSTRVVTQFPDYQMHERDLENLILSGKEWVGEAFSKNEATQTFAFNFPNLVTEKPVQFAMKFNGRSITEPVYISASSSGQTLVDSAIMQRLSADNPMYAREITKTESFEANGDQVDVQLSFGAEDVSSSGWLNFIRLNAWRQLIYTGSPLAFRNNQEAGTGAILQFEVQQVTAGLQLWDVTNPLSPASQQYISEPNNVLTFKVATDSIRQYFLFDVTDALSISSAKAVANQNLHSLQSADMVIVAHPRFLSQARELADLHQTNDGLSSLVVNVEEIYNEFGGGIPDPTAIRDFMRMIYVRSNENLKYLLLFGDASFDYKNRVPGNTNLVPTYQAASSFIETQSFVSDDYFGLMDPQEGSNMMGILDIGIGRFPVSTEEDASIMVEKIKHYSLKQMRTAGQWRNNITFIADDRDNNLHFDQAETLSSYVDTARQNLNLNKIYLDAYPRSTVTGGYRYPDANKAFVDQVQQGSLVINYTGHGGINGLSDERVLTIPDINGFTNIDRMPFFITATCEFSRFDNPEFVSAGEQLLLNPKGGGIGLMTTTRLAFAHSNFALNRKVYAAMFDRSDPDFKRLGDILRLSKNPTSSSIYNFVLLGDPALRLAYPEHTVVTTALNEKNSFDNPITLHALSEVKIEGTVLDADGQTDTDFNGFLYPKMFDKKTVFNTLANDPNSVSASFEYFEKLLYKGKVTVKDGLFSFRFLLPRDISFNYGMTKISYYAIDTVRFIDASGLLEDIILGGTDENVAIDADGPQIDLYLNHPTFKNGDLLPTEVVLHAKISDPQGIHYLGNTIGRDIILTKDNQSTSRVNLNDMFVPTLDDFSSGSIVYPLHQLSQGEHQLTLKAWDLHNNSTEASAWFIVDSSAELALQRVLNYPNPFSEETRFVFDHNKTDEQFDVEINIYDAMGQFVAALKATSNALGTAIEPIVWDGRDANGNIIPTGIYVYRVLVSDQSGNKFQVNQRLVYIRK